MSQKFYVAADRSIHGPVTNRKKTVNSRDGKVMFTGTPGPVYAGGTELPQSYIDYATNKKERNGETLLQNLLDGGFIVFAPGDKSPLAAKFAPVLSTERDLTGAQ